MPRNLASFGKYHIFRSCKRFASLSKTYFSGGGQKDGTMETVKLWDFVAAKLDHALYIARLVHADRNISQRGKLYLDHGKYIVLK